MPRSVTPLWAPLALGGGVLVALSLPPWGWWPLAFIGIAAFEVALGAEPSRRQRLGLGALFAAGWLFLGMCWMWFLTPPGYIAASAIFAGYHAVAALVAPTGRWRLLGRPAAHTAAEALRFVFPFGGVPLASLAISQSAGPLLPIVRVGGALLLTWVTFQLGFALGAAPDRRLRIPALIGAVAALLVLPLAWLAPDGTATTAGPLRVTIVQGGGPQGTHAVEAGDSAEVFARHLDASRTIAPGSTDLVVWPENVVDVGTFAGSASAAAIAEQAARVDAPFAVGVTEDAGPDHFLNAEVIVAPDGTITSRYDKVRRVPFGEYMPLRSLLSAIGAPTNLVPRDAVAGTGPAVLTLPSGLKIGVVISWEVFFGGRANEGVVHGGTMILNPTNGSSYTWTVLQSQQIASSRLRAVEQGRWVAQAAPTGFSAFVSPSGEVIDRTSVSEQAIISHTITTHTARTWYSHLGSVPIVVLAVAANFVAVAGKKRRWRSRATPAIASSIDRPSAFGAIFDRHATVVHRYLVRRLGPGEAEAITGDVFRIAFERRASFDPTKTGDADGSARPWLYGIATNLVAKHRRREIRRVHAVARLAAVRGAPLDPADDVVAEVDAATRWRIVAEALARLPQPELDVLVLHVWEQLDYADVASSLGVPLGTVRSRLHRARRHLRELTEAITVTEGTKP